MSGAQIRPARGGAIVHARTYAKQWPRASSSELLGAACVAAVAAEVAVAAKTAATAVVAVLPAAAV